MKTMTDLPPGISQDFLATLAARVDVPAEGRDSIEVDAPCTREVIARVPQAEAADVAAAVDRSRLVQQDWERLSPKMRGRIFSRYHDLLVDRFDQALDLVQLESGKARSAAFEDVADVVATTRYYIHTAPRLLRGQRRAVSLPLTTTTFEYRKPRGVVGFIVPWNYPFNLGIADAVPALLAGNGAIIKPDEKTPLSLLYSVCLLEEAGLPPGLIQVVTGDGEKVGPHLIDAVDYVMFTGSTAVGRLVAEQAGRRLIGASMELGGKNAALVLADADLDVTVPGLVRGVVANAGQICVGMERIYVHSSIRERFTERFVEAVSDLEIGPRYDFSAHVGSLISPEHSERVHAHVEDAVAKGARLLIGGKPRPDLGPSFYEPTVLTDVDESMEVCRTETFGPVATIYGFDTVDEAVARANDSEFGLNFSVWTGDTRQGMRLARRLEAGTVGVNDAFAAAWSSFDAPMGGVKASGLSRRHGAEGLLKYTQSQTVAAQRWVPSFAPPAGLSYDTYLKLLRPALKLLRRLPFYK